ncbi:MULTISPECIES: helix-turn-helix domain-containing protein [unclassified Streptomyces]|uniref:helix-turn-helix domain-containing protein n=1 Tax=unclassified Streptomyces TaxID=2593676 RepID=UPI00380187AE
MGRRESPTVSCAPALAELVKWLREQRSRTGLTYRELGRRAGCAATTLQRAASGRTIPRRSVVEAYAWACGGSVDEAVQLWKRARYAERRSQRIGPTVLPPQPELIHDVAELSAALLEAWERAGAPSLRTMEAQAGGFGALPRTTLQRIISKQAVPRSMGQFEAMLRACEIPEPERQTWLHAYARVWKSHREGHDFGIAYTWHSPHGPLESQVRTQV